MDGFIDIGLVSGWSVAVTVVMTVLTMVFKGALVPGPTHAAIVKDRDYYRDELRKIQSELIQLPHVIGDLQTAQKLQEGLLNRYRDPNQGAT
jgi:hypothetical protein